MEDIPDSLMLPANGMFGALYALIKTGGVESTTFSNEIIDKFGIITIPGKAFYGENVDAVRLSLVATPWNEGDTLWKENVKTLKQALA